MRTLYGESLIDFGGIVRRKIFISFHHKNDHEYCNYLSQQFDKEYEVVSHNRLDPPINSRDPQYVMRVIRDKYIHGSSCTVVLLGEFTYSRKYVDWEIKATLDKGHGLLGIVLPNQLNYQFPSRFVDNCKTGCAGYVMLDDILGKKSCLSRHIELANSKSKRLIVNERKMMDRNGAILTSGGFY